jgi:hypothetical protein
MDPGAPAHFFNSEAMWYALGLQGVTGKPFLKEEWQYNLMALTPFGKYPPDNHPSLVAFAKYVSGRHGYPVYCGSIKKWCLSLAKNPINEFYSLEAAKTGDSAFSLEAYLERYRTLDDSGNRLESSSENPAGERVRGKDGKYYTIGNRIVSQALLNKVSVCRPTHVVFNVGINDGDYLIVQETQEAYNGEIVVALVNDGMESGATVKRFYRESDHIRLQPENDYMEPIIAEDVTVVGKVKGVFRYFN